MRKPAYSIGDRVIWDGQERIVIGTGPWKYKDASEPWYTLRVDSLAHEIELASQGFRRGFFSAWEKELEPA